MSGKSGQKNYIVKTESLIKIVKCKLSVNYIILKYFVCESYL